MINLTPFENTVQRLKDEGKYRVFNDIVRERGEFPNSIWYGPYNIKNIVNWCSNDYLGMGQHKVVIDAMHTALDQTGSGSGGTRNIGGTSHYHVALEHELAKLHSKESALLYTSAYVANEWTLVSLKQIIPDIILVPLLVFDKAKYRLGYGKGFYDRYLNKYLKKFKNILTVGVAFSFQKYHKLPVNNRDVKLNFILTEKGFY